jgi:aspartyl-tRNA(Asn)/glutamyl-tRNA(Gln) amidotransferase subunit A
MHYTIIQIQEQIREGKTSCVTLTQQYLKNISEKKELNAFVEVFETYALQRAQEIDAKIQNNSAGILAGLVIGIKDNICMKGMKVSASSKILENFTSLYSSTVVEKLLEADAIIIGRLNCDEFAMGSSNENSYYGVVKNPLAQDRVPGGSSGGSAAAVAANLCHAALGSDTGGSIRLPASFTNLVGFKPTYGRVSRHGIIAYASSFDQVGPITHNVFDAALITQVIAGADNFDSTVSQKAVENYSQVKENTKKKIAIIKESIYSEGLNPLIKEAFMSKLEKLKAQGYEINEVSFELLPFLVPAYYVLTTAEASSNLSRYDGINYGYRSNKATDLESTYKLSRSEGFGKEVQRRIMLGTFVLSAGYYDAYYAKAQKVRRLIKEKTKAIFENNDFILMPTAPNVAFKIGQKTKDPIEMYLEDIYTVQANLCGMPCISVPLGKNEENLPFGIQVMANDFEETHIFNFATHLLAL